jgi:hypothetical protein
MLDHSPASIPSVEAAGRVALVAIRTSTAVSGLTLRSAAALDRQRWLTAASVELEQGAQER